MGLTPETLERKGKLLVIEGIDGSGKSTQFSLLKQHLDKEGHRTVGTIKFPQYGEKSAGPIEEYLNGKYGDPDLITPYTASLFYAVDRFAASYKIRTMLAEGLIVLLDRYIDSNAGHQGGKITDDTEREKFLFWLRDLEYRILNIPHPDQTIILRMPPKVGQELVAKKEQRLYLEKGTHDGHEANIAHLKRAEAAYLWLAKRESDRYSVVECIENGELLPPEKIHVKVWRIVEPLVREELKGMA